EEHRSWLALLHRRVHQAAQHGTDIGALAGTLHHEHREQVLLRIDPEECSGHAAPEEITERSRERRDARMGSYREAETETMTGRHQGSLCPDVGTGRGGR